MSNPIKIGAKMDKIASVNVTYNAISAGDSVGVYPSSDTKESLSNLVLKPLTYFNFSSDTSSYVLYVNVLTGSHHLPDPKNALECKTVGKNVLVFLNFAITKNKPESDDYMNYRYRIEFLEDFTSFIKGKEIIIITASGDPEEGDVSKVIVEDEDEI